LDYKSNAIGFVRRSGIIAFSTKCASFWYFLDPTIEPN